MSQPITGETARHALAGPATQAARRLIGATLVRVFPDGTRASGRIVETEAYLGVQDRASHAFGGRRTPRNESMYCGPGVGYVYFTYGMHFCFNVVCGELGVPAAVLIRALQPLEGLDAMRARRRPKPRPGATPLPPKPMPTRDLCNGPAKLCQALEIDRALDRIDVLSDPRLWIELGETAVPVKQGVRIGIDSAGEWAEKKLRWVEAGSEFVSRGV